MSHPVKAAFETVDRAFPEGTAAAGFLLVLTQVNLPAPAEGEPEPVPRRYEGTAALDAREVTVADVEPGTYRGAIALVDAEGAPLAAPVEAAATITVAEPSPVSFPVPSALTLTLP